MLCLKLNNNGFYALSSDGINWKEETVSVSETINSCKIIDGILFVIGEVSFYGKNENENNLIEYITTDSDMNFELAKGENKIKLYADEGTINANIVFKQKYIGV